MANPVTVDCPQDTWTIVAQNVTAGQIKMLTKGPVYLETYRMTGEDAPTESSEGVAIFLDTYAEVISASAAIDVYVMARGSAGKVRADLP